MLINFTVGNFRSFRDRATLSLEANQEEYLDANNICSAAGKRLLKSCALYGLNSGGKSNYLRAIVEMARTVIATSQVVTRDTRTSLLQRMRPFRLSVAHATQPCFFEAEFVVEATVYRFGFEADNKKVCREWLLRRNGDDENVLFLRDESDIQVSELFPEGLEVVDRTTPDLLFLTAVAAWNGETATSIINWFLMWRARLQLGRFVTDIHPRQLEDVELRTQIEGLAAAASLGFANIGIQESESLSNPYDIRIESSGEVVTYHPVFDDEGREVRQATFHILEESSGTRKFLSLCAFILPYLESGGVLIIDELEANMHPGLTRQIVSLFHGPANRGSAQLIFATHDTKLLNPELTRRDQIWFVDKDPLSNSYLTRLSQFEGTHGDDIEREYLLGLYGAVPNRFGIDKHIRLKDSSGRTE